MKKIRINVKSAPIYNQIEVRANEGFKNVEVQLINKFLSNNEYEDTKRAIEELGIDISVVHTPLIKETHTEIALNHLLEEENIQIFKDTCKYAQYIANIEGHRIKVVIHNDFSEKIWKQTSLLEDKIIPIIQDTLNENKGVDLVVENTPSITSQGFRTMFSMKDVSYAVKVIRDTVGDRVNTLIDTCHMMMSWEGWKRFSYQNLENWDESFKEATMYTKLGLIHLNNIHDNGLGADHGIPFYGDNEDDMRKLKEIMDAYEKYADCEITIEVSEKDYLDIPYNVIETRKSLEKLYNKNNIISG